MADDVEIAIVIFEIMLSVRVCSALIWHMIIRQWGQSSFYFIRKPLDFQLDIKKAS